MGDGFAFGPSRNGKINARCGHATTDNNNNENRECECEDVMVNAIINPVIYY